jgi:hypothetical protein
MLSTPLQPKNRIDPLFDTQPHGPLDAPGAINLPHDSIDPEIRRVLPDLEADVIVYCASGRAEETQIQASFGEAIGIAKEQKAVSLEKRAETTYAEYRRQRASGPGRRRFRVPLDTDGPLKRVTTSGKQN